MIGIKVNDKLVEEHYKGIEQLLEGRKKYTISNINKWIKKITGDKYSFEEVVKAKELEEIIKIVNDTNINKSHIEKVDNGKGKIKDKRVFDLKENYWMLNLYKDFASKGIDLNVNEREMYGAWKLVKNLKLDVCPYCNRNFIINTKINSKEVTKIRRTAQLDHFYSESQYPYLALSFYNLIPSCPTCNLFKLDKDIGVNPYTVVNSDDNIRFDYDFNESINEKIISTEYRSKEFELNWKLLGLEELYKSHSNYLKDLLSRIQIYNSIYKSDIDSFLNKLSNGEESSKIELNELPRIILGNYYKEEDLSKQPLAKLTKDIYNRYK